MSREYSRDLKTYKSKVCKAIGFAVVCMLAILPIGCATQKENVILKSPHKPEPGMTFAESLLVSDAEAAAAWLDEIVLINGGFNFFVRNGRLSHMSKTAHQFSIDAISQNIPQKSYGRISVRSNELDDLYLKSFETMIERGLKSNGWEKNPNSKYVIEVEFKTEKEQKFSSYTNSQPVLQWYHANRSFFSVNQSGFSELKGVSTGVQAVAGNHIQSSSESRTAINSRLKVTMFESGESKRKSVWQVNVRIDDSATDARSTFARLLSAGLPAFGYDLKQERFFWQATNDPRVRYLMGEDGAIGHTQSEIPLNALKGVVFDFSSREAREIRNQSGVSILHLAARVGAVTLVNVLLDVGADINQKSGIGFVPLRYAIAARQKSVIKTLVERGANLSFEFGWGVGGGIKSEFADLREVIEKENLYDGPLPERR